MAAMEEEVKKLREELARKDAEIEELRKRLEEKVGNLDYLSEKDGLSSYPGLLSLQNDRESGSPSLSPTDTRPPRLEGTNDGVSTACNRLSGSENTPKFEKSSTLDNATISRYSRQLILPEIGPRGQICLQNSSVLIVGAGGLGCPAAVYLAAAGVGRLGVVDYDEVEESNLHRQILHTEGRVGLSKAESVAQSCRQINSRMVCIPYCTSLSSGNAMTIVDGYNVVLDATDNVASRYLLNDLCVLTGKPLVSGSALRFEGQLTVYNWAGGPCYRCLFPKPPPPEMVTNCSDGGVLGAVPGVIGVLQALEAIKIVSGAGTTLSQRLLMFDGLDGTFRNVKLRPSQTSCAVCGEKPSIDKLIDYEQFCGARASDKDKALSLLKKEERINVKEYKSVVSSGQPHLLLDVRLPVELEICQLPNTTNIPLSSLLSEDSLALIKEKVTTLQKAESPVPVFVLCRQGNDSQRAVRMLKEKLLELPVELRDIEGGLRAWTRLVDSSFPLY